MTFIFLNPMLYKYFAMNLYNFIKYKITQQACLDARIMLPIYDTDSFDYLLDAVGSLSTLLCTFI